MTFLIILETPSDHLEAIEKLLPIHTHPRPDIVIAWTKEEISCGWIKRKVNEASAVPFDGDIFKIKQHSPNDDGLVSRFLNCVGWTKD